MNDFSKMTDFPNVVTAVLVFLGAVSLICIYGLVEMLIKVNDMALEVKELEFEVGLLNRDTVNLYSDAAVLEQRVNNISKELEISAAEVSELDDEDDMDDDWDDEDWDDDWEENNEWVNHPNNVGEKKEGNNGVRIDP